MQRIGVVTGLTALFLLINGVAILCLRIWIFDCIISWAIVLGPKSQVVDSWTKPPIEVLTNFYLFNWTNPEEIKDPNSKPIFEEMGPYAFITVTEKVNVSWNENNTVTFNLFQAYHFDEKRSKGKLTDVITTLNTVTMSAAHKLRHEAYLKKRGFSVSLGWFAPELHITQTAGELLFQGYEDPYVNIGQTLPFLNDGPADYDKAGFLYGRNNSYTVAGVFNIANGVNGNMGEILRWNYDNKIKHYTNSCAELGGSIGDFFHQRQTKDPVKIYISDICHNLKLDYEDDSVVKDILGYKYSAKHSLLDNGTLVPENECGCGGECVPYGLVNLTECTYGSPTFLSLPHFYGADPTYLDRLEGLKPEKLKHELFITIEPRIGFCIDLALRIQLNFLLHPIPDITLYEDVPTVFMPALWSEQRVSVPAEFAWKINILLNLPNLIFPIIGATFILGGFLILFIQFYFTNKMYVKQSELENKNNMKFEQVPLKEKPMLANCNLNLQNT